MTIRKGHLYLAPPKQQLIIEGSNLKLSRGFLGNKNRRSIDVLLESAADNFGHRPIGIILTGMLRMNGRVGSV